MWLPEEIFSMCTAALLSRTKSSGRNTSIVENTGTTNAGGTEEISDPGSGANVSGGGGGGGML